MFATWPFECTTGRNARNDVSPVEVHVFIAAAHCASSSPRVSVVAALSLEIPTIVRMNPVMNQHPRHPFTVSHVPPALWSFRSDTSLGRSPLPMRRSGSMPAALPAISYGISPRVAAPSAGGIRTRNNSRGTIQLRPFAFNAMPLMREGERGDRGDGERRAR